jgi:hypothetical protein
LIVCLPALDLLVVCFYNDNLLLAESPAGESRGQEDGEEEERMVLEDQPLVSEAVATLLAEVVSQTDEVRQGQSGRLRLKTVQASRVRLKELELGGPGQEETVFQA